MSGIDFDHPDVTTTGARSTSVDTMSHTPVHVASATQAGRSAHSYDEFSPLREVIIGSALNAQIPTTGDLSVWTNMYPDLTRRELATVSTGQFPQRVVEETNEDLERLVQTLVGLGIAVHRPDPVPHSRGFATPNWTSDGFYSYCPRDLALVIGSTIIETPSPMRARYFETNGLRPIFQRCLHNGSSWISAPKPQLLDDLYELTEHGIPALGELEPVFEAANVLRCGSDLFYQVSVSGNELGRIWLEAALRSQGTFTVHPLRGIYAHTHIDSTIAFIRPGLVLLNPERVNEENMPSPLRSWDVIWCPPIQQGPVASAHPLSTPWVGMNLLMVTPGLAIVDADQRDLIQALERKGIDVIPHTLRHSRVLGGGFHCVSLDLVRDGQLESYFD